MTVTSAVCRASYTAVGAETSVAVPFQVQRTGDLQVYLTPSGGSVSLLVYGTHYTIATADLGSATCEIALVTPATAGDLFELRRVLPLLQDLDIRNQGSYQPESLEGQLDRVTQMIQAQGEDIDELSGGTGGTFIYDTVAAAALPVADTTNAGRIYRVRDTGVQDRFAVSIRLSGGTFTMMYLPLAPGTSTDNALLRSDGTAGAVQGSPVVVSDAGDVSGVASLAVTGATTLTGGVTGEMAATGAVSGTTITGSGDVTSGGHLRGLKATAALTGSTAIATAGKFLIDITNTSGSNTFTLSAPSSVDGQLLILRVAAITAGDLSLADSGNVSLAGAWATPGVGDTLTLVASGVIWYEVCRSNN